MDLPSTLERSSDKAQRTFAKTVRSAEGTYDDPGRARRVAYGSLKHSFEKVGDHWEPKEQKGPSDHQSERSGRGKVEHPERSAEGVDANASKSHLYGVAKRLDIEGRSRMGKDELVQAIEKENRSRTARARR